MMFKSCQFFRISLPFYLQTILKMYQPKKELFQLSQTINLFNLIGEMFTLCQSTIQDAKSYQINLAFLRQHLSINLSQRSSKRSVPSNNSTNISNFLQSCLQKMPNSMKNIYLQLYMLFIRLFETKCVASMKQTQLKDIKILENYISSLYRSIKLVLSFQSQYSRLQIKDYVELAINFLLKNQISERFKETLISLNALCQLPETTIQLIEKTINSIEKKPLTRLQLTKISKISQKQTFSEKEIFRNKTKKKITSGMLASKLTVVEKKTMETPQKQNQSNLKNSNYIDLTDVIELTPQIKCKHDVINPQTSKSPLKNSNKKFKTRYETRYLESPCSSKKTHFIKKTQEKKKKKNRTLYATRKGIFNNFKKRDDYLQIDVCKTATQSSIHFDSAKKSSYIPPIIEKSSQDFDILAHQTPRQNLKKTRTAKFAGFDRSGNFQLK